MPKEVTWNAPEFEHRPKTVSWYWLTIIASVLFIGVAVWQKNILFGIFVVIAEVLILVWAEREPRTIAFRLTERELIIDAAKKHRLDEFASFSVDRGNDEEFIDAFLRFKSHIRPVLKIRVPSKKISSATEVFLVHMPEMQFEPTLLDAIEKLLRF